MRRALCATLLAAGCGLGGAAGGGSDHLPTAGAGPYGKPDGNRDTPAEEPYVVVDDGANLSHPTARRAQGGGFDVWYERRELVAGVEGDPEVWFAHVPDVDQKPDAPPKPALALAMRPSVVELADGRLAMYHEDPAAPGAGIMLATSADGGLNWAREGMVVAAGGDPAALVLDDGTVLLYVQSGSAIVLHRSADGLTFAEPPITVITTDGTSAQAFGHVRVGEPAAVGGTTAAGQVRIGLFYVGENLAGEHAILHAASADGVTFARFFNGDPILDPGGVDERGPSAVLEPDRGYLFFSQVRGATTAIAVALHP
jgi:hypothetical protein